MDIVRFVAERKISRAIDEGLFAGLPTRGQIDCSLAGDKFFAWWFRAHYGHDALMEREEEQAAAEKARERDDVLEKPEETTGGTGTLPQGGVPNPGFTARGD
jgi:hypothetical protein